MCSSSGYGGIQLTVNRVFLHFVVTGLVVAPGCLILASMVMLTTLTNEVMISISNSGGLNRVAKYDWNAKCLQCPIVINVFKQMLMIQILCESIIIFLCMHFVYIDLLLSMISVVGPTVDRCTLENNTMYPLTIYCQLIDAYINQTYLCYVFYSQCSILNTK